VEVDVLNLNLSALQNHEFVVGIAVAAIMVSALVASSLFRNVALALAAGGIVLLYLQGGIGSLMATSKLLENEIRTLPVFSNGMMVGLAIAAVLMVGMRQRSST
jgi:heme A synthase